MFSGSAKQNQGSVLVFPFALQRGVSHRNLWELCSPRNLRLPALNFQFLCLASCITYRGGFSSTCLLKKPAADGAGPLPGAVGPPEPPTRSCCPPGSSDGGQHFARFASVNFIISAGPAERMLANGLSAASGFSSPFLHIGLSPALSGGGLLLPRVLDVTSVL